ncbi:phage tail protein [Pseudomonas plecoglossicida]|uniref:Phage tail protein n=1 Tax=Pseudomonas plecoglossicida TaxID=70775 RepID=A0ABX4U5Q3_PSEDL|nr:tail fiber assembly protein [Pseudomonas plecoglossicida]PLU86358.1 phage tail protein [Pseudomonas plecoglossicida]PLU94111.1 phage tail protein [Pseudomonas plecoglossicida]PLV04952.1 phage tail protein [Pseudomonas plecoglossicida]PLV14227.1 phage tail protein [Pseudomonas plecoglossicida]
MARAAINILGDGSIIDITSLGKADITVEHPGPGQYQVAGTLGMCPPPEGWGYVINQMDAGASVVTSFADEVLLVSVTKDGEPADLLHSITLHVSVEETPVPLPPEPIPADPLQQAQEEAARLRVIADAAIAPLQDAVDLEEATEAEVVLLKEWKRFRVALNRLPEQAGYPANIEWPNPPL